MAANTQELRFIVNLEDNASRGISAIKRNLSDAEPVFRSMRNVGVAGFAALTAAISLSVKETIEAEAAQNRLTHILKTSRGATDAQVQVLLDQAKALEKVGVVAGDSIVQAQAQLATFDLTSESIERLTPAILDYVVAERGAAATTDDLKSLTNGLAQALQGNFASLTKTGFVLDDATKALIENGTEAERTAALVTVLNSTYKGFNESARVTTEGSLLAMRNEFNNLREVIGEQFLPILQKVSETLTPFMLKVSEWIQANPELTRTIILATAAVFGLLTVVGLLGLAILPLITAFTVLSGPVGIVIGILVTLTGTVWQLVQIMDTLQHHMVEVWAGIKAIFKESITWIIENPIQALIASLERVLSLMSRIPGLSAAKGALSIAQKVLPFAEGGIVTRPTLGLVGEAGPEAVIPLSKMGQMGGLHITITGNNFMGEQDAAEKIGDMIIRQLQGSQRLSPV